MSNTRKLESLKSKQFSFINTRKLNLYFQQNVQAVSLHNVFCRSQMLFICFDIKKYYVFIQFVNGSSFKEINNFFKFLSDLFQKRVST